MEKISIQLKEGFKLPNGDWCEGFDINGDDIINSTEIGTQIQFKEYIITIPQHNILGCIAYK